MNKTKYHVLFLFFISLSFSDAFSQCTGITIDLGPDKIFCNGQDITLNLNYSDPNNSISEIKWLGPKVINNVTSSLNINNVKSNDAGVYYCEVKVSGCVNVLKDSVKLTILNNLQIYAGSDLYPCPGSNVNLSGSISGNSGNNVSYSWSGPNNYSSTGNNITLNNITTLQSGNYTILASVGNCTVNDKVKVTVIEPIAGGTNLKNYNNQQWLVKCTDVGESSGKVFLENGINDISILNKINSYKIDWGDGSSSITKNAPWDNKLNHLYNLGLYTLTISFETNDGCTATNTYNVFVGNQPASPQIQLPQNAQGCSPVELTFPISGFSDNIPGTTYIITFSDNNQQIFYNQNTIPNSISHTFNSSSCDNQFVNGSITEKNAFGVSIQAINPCGSSSSSAGPVRTSSPPTVDLTLPSLICVNTIANAVNISDHGKVVSSNSCISTSAYYWEITPNLGWTIESGSVLGDNGGEPTDFNGWNSGSEILKVKYTQPGSYTVKLIEKNTCSSVGTAEKIICVQAPPTPSFTASKLTGCTPQKISFTNTSTGLPTCGSITRLWTVTKTGSTCIADSTSDYAYVSGTNSSSDNPIIRFKNQGTYSVTLSLTNVCGTFTSTAKIITIKRKPQASISIPQNICIGQTVSPSATVTNCADNPLTYQWSFDGGNPANSSLASPPTITFSTTGSHQVSLSITNECGTTVENSTINVLSIPTSNAGIDKMICSGGNVQIGTTPVSGLTYSWSPSTGLSDPLISNPIVSLLNTGNSSITQTYTLTVTNISNCSSVDNVIITVNPLPTISSTSQTICSGQTATLTASGADTYLWSTTSTSNPLSISPLITTDYTVTGTSTLTGCSNTGNGKVTVNPLPAVNAGPSISLCNQPIANTLTGFSPTSGGTWSGTGVSASGVFTPSATGSFILTYSYKNTANSCVNSDTMKVKVISPEVANAGTGFTKCLNDSDITLTGFYPSTGGTWSGIGVTGNIFKPSTIGSYNLTYTYGSGTCLSSDTIHIKVNALPTISSTSQTICSGQSASLTASGGDTYLWSTTSNSTSTSNPLSISPLITTDYTVTGTSTLTGCTNTATGKVTVNPLPVVNAGSSISLCNQPIANTLIGFSPTSGGTWSGVGVSASGVFTPSTTGSFVLTYSFTNTTTSCVNSDTMKVAVVAPEIANAGTGFTKCLNDPDINLTGFYPTTGGTWSGTGVTGNIFKPSTIGSYNLTYTFGSGTCLSSDTIHIKVNALPNISSTSQTICSGQSASLTASGGDTYLWSTTSNSTSTSNPLSISPLITTDYSVTGTSTITGCTNTATGKVTVNPLPVVNAGTSISLCNQPIANTLTGFSPSSGGTWTGSGVSASGVFTPSTNGSFVLTYSFTNTANSCVNSDTMKVTVVAPEIANAGTGFTKCLNDPDVTLNGFYPASGGTWFGTGVTGNIFKPSTIGNYNLTYTFGSGTCLSSDTIHIKVNALPNISSTSQTICSGQSASLTASGGDTYLWSTTSNSTSTSNPLSISPLITTDYSVTGTSTITGCTNTATGKVTVNPLPVVNAGSSISLCNQPIANTLTGFSPTSGGTWSGTGVSASGEFTPSSTGSFVLTYSFTNTANLCVNTDTMKVTVVAPEIANAGTGFTKCLKDPDINLTGFYPTTGGTWSGTGVIGTTFTPSTVGNYFLTYSFGEGTCLSTDTINIKVNALPVITSLVETICIGQSASLLASGGDTYLWSTTSTSNPLSISPSITTDYTVTGTSTLTGCKNTATGKVTVNPLPVVNAGPSITLCNQPIANTLAGFSPSSGGTWSGTGVSASGVFTPSTIGSFVLTYSFTNTANSCVNSDTMKVTVVAPEIAIAGTGFSKCFNSPDETLTGFYPTFGGTWSGTGVTGTTFTPSTVGNYFLTYSFGEGTCLSTDTINIKVNALPVITSSVETICIGQSASLLASGGDTYLWSTTSTSNPLSISPSITTDYTVTGTSTLTGCKNTATGKVTVNPLPVVNAGPSITLCNQPISNTLAGFSPTTGGTWSGPGVTSSGVFTPSAIGNFILTYSYTNPANLCVNSDTMKVTVVAPEIAIAGNDQVICLNNGELILTNFSPTMGVWSGLGISNSIGTFNPLNSGVGDFELTLSYGSGTCFSQDKKTITVLTLPSISAGNDKTFCKTDPISNFIGSPLNGVWSGNGIIDFSTGKFDPNIAGVGTHTIVYCVTDPITSCKNYDSIIVKVNPLPISSFSFNPIACKNITQLFSNTSTLGTNPLWIFDDLSTSSDMNTTHIFNNIGTFPVKLIETSMYGCKDSIVQFVEVREPPIAIFTVSSDSICGPATISITNISTGLFNTYSWDFGNSTSSTLLNPPPVLFQKGYIKDTTYIIKLITNNLCGTSVQTIPIKVMPTPKSIFGTNLDFGCSPLHINFTNKSLGLPDNTLWNYGDGTISTDNSLNTSHVFTTSTHDTTYLIKLIETNECGTDTSEYSILVHPNTANAFFNTNKISGCSPLKVDFTNFSTNNVFNNWDFGDGNNSTLLNPSHTFNQGNYKVALYINNGCSYDTAYVDITVFPLQLVDFSYAPDSVCINKPFQFTNLSNGLASSTWDFGDGNSSILTNPTHSYTSSGSYTVKLTGISSTNGCSAEISHTIKIKSTPVSNFLTSLNNGCIPLPVNFTNSSINSNFQYWDFGDGNTSNLNSPIHTYQTAGNYTIKQVSINLNGCKDSITHSIIANPLPISNFTITVSDVCTSPLIVNTTNMSTDAVNFTWNFNNGTILSNLNNPTSSYSSSGDYTITLISENIFQCKDTSEIKLNVSPILDVTFNIPDNINCRKEVLLFNSSVNFGDSVVWNFGNGEKKTGNPVWYIYPQSGQFDVSVVAYGNNGCTDTSAISKITVLPSPVADFESYNIKIDDKASGTIQFTNHSLLANNYKWDFGDGFSSKDIDPIHKYLHNSNATVTLYAINNYGCKDTISKLIEVDFFYGLFIPATMYPGHEVFGVANFVPIGVGIKEFEILVYDDWGNLVWKSTALDEDGRPSEYWNGLFDGNVNTNGKGSGAPVQQDAYVWKATATFIDGSIWQGCPNVKGNISTSGSLTVIR